MEHSKFFKQKKIPFALPYLQLESSQTQKLKIWSLGTPGPDSALGLHICPGQLLSEGRAVHRGSQTGSFAQLKTGLTTSSLNPPLIWAKENNEGTY